MEITPGVSWINEDQFLFSTVSRFENRSKGGIEGLTRDKKFAMTQPKERNKINQDYFTVEGRLPDKENKILISIIPGVPDGMQRSGEAFRPYPSTMSTT